MTYGQGQNVWVMHLGKRGIYEEQALDANCLILEAAVDLSLTKTREVLRDAIAREFADRSPSQRAYSFGIVAAFAVDMAIGDIVICPMKTTGNVAIGRISGPIIKESGVFLRSVDWLKTDVPRGAFEEDMRYKFSLVRTINRIASEDALQRVMAIVEGSGAPAQRPADPDLTPESEAESEGDAFNLIEMARDQIEQRIANRFHGHEFTELIAAILRAQGYLARVSPPGPDAGIDIVAGRGELGFDSPKLVVQVKSGKVTGDQPTLQSLIGSVQDAQADQGLLVCWSGFTQAVRKRTNELFFRIRLWGREEILNALFSVYDDLPEEIRAELPLQRTWTLLQTDP